MRWLLVLLVLAVYALHQDTWNFPKTAPFFGPLPIGLAYHALFCVLAAVTLAILVRFAWPAELEEVESLVPESSEGAHG